MNRVAESVDQTGKHRATIKRSTASEINNAGFSVQKSSNGIDFTELGVVESKADHGESDAVLNYEMIDNACEGLTYYQINQYDYDGTTDYGRIMSIQCDIDETISLYPNPTVDQIQLDIQSE